MPGTQAYAAREPQRKFGTEIYRQAISASPSPFGILDEHGCFTEVNDAFRREFGPPRHGSVYTLDELKPEQAKFAKNRLARLSRRGVTPRGIFFEAIGLSSEKARCWHAQFTPIFDERNNARWAACALTEISRADRNAKRARDLHFLFAASVDHSPDAIFLKTASHRYRYINEAGAAMLGRTPREIIGRADAELFDAESARKMAERDRFLLRGPEHGISYLDEDLINGQRISFKTTKRPLRGPRGETLGLLGVSRDITSEIEAENEIKALKQEIATLKEEGAYRRNFVAGLAHDLRSPLTVAKMAAQFLSHEPGADIKSSAKFSAHLLGALDRMDVMIRDLLDAGRICAGAGAANDPRRINLTQALTRAIAELSVVHRTVRGNFSNAPAVACFADPRAVARMLENLVHNAAKHGSKSKPITVEAGNPYFRS
ncbi:MAG: PAS domain S-box protein, partial [Proteobacteria bacterium]